MPENVRALRSVRAILSGPHICQRAGSGRDTVVIVTPLRVVPLPAETLA